MRKDRVSASAGATALLFLGAFAHGSFAAADVPAICPPPFAGNLHPWVSTAALAGVLMGAVFFPRTWQRGFAWAWALTFAMFEFTFAVPLSAGGAGFLPTPAQRLDRAMSMASAFGLFVLLFSPAWVLRQR